MLYASTIRKGEYLYILERSIFPFIVPFSFLHNEKPPLFWHMGVEILIATIQQCFLVLILTGLDSGRAKVGPAEVDCVTPCVSISSAFTFGVSDPIKSMEAFKV